MDYDEKMRTMEKKTATKEKKMPPMKMSKITKEDVVGDT